MKLSVINDAPKPHKGRISSWAICKPSGTINDLLPIVVGYLVDHPDFHNEWGHTSPVVSISEPNQFGYRELETNNSRYTLVGKELTWDEYIKARQLLEGNSGAQAYKLLSPTVERPASVQTVSLPICSPEAERKLKAKRNVNKAYYSERTEVSSDNGRHPKGRGLPQST